MKLSQDKLSHLKTSAIIAMCFFGLVACGGGGGGSAAGTTPASYSGLTTPAEVNSANAGEISSSALLAGSANVGVLSATANQGATSTGLANLGQVVAKVLAARTADSGKLVAQAMVSDSGSMPGACGGSVSFHITIDDGTLDFAMTMNFKNYCEAGVKVAGSANVSGSTNQSGTVMSMTMTGSKMVITENATHTVCQYKDYTFNFDIDHESMTLAIAGTFYHQDYGYVYCTTLSPFTTDDVYNDNYPSSGSLLIIEDNDNPDSATLTALNNVQCQIDIDFGNDGIIDEFNIEEWSSL